MIKTENDKKILKAGYPAIVPFLMEEYKGEVDIEVYSSLKKQAKSFLEEFNGHLFSKRALDYISSSLDSYIEENGYTRDKKGATLYYYSYEIKDPSLLDTSSIRSDTHRLFDLFEEIQTGKLKNRTTFKLGELLEKSLESFVTVCNGEVVSIATVNETLDKTRMLEVTVETAVAHRRCGYAISNVEALASHILSNGGFAAYCCRSSNTKSAKIAERAGFERVGRFYAVTAYKNTR